MRYKEDYGCYRIEWSILDAATSHSLPCIYCFPRIFWRLVARWSRTALELETGLRFFHPIMKSLVFPPKRHDKLFRVLSDNKVICCTDSAKFIPTYILQLGLVLFDSRVFVSWIKHNMFNIFIDTMHHPAPLSARYNLLTDSSIRSTSHQRKCIKYSMEFPFVVFRRCRLCCHIAPFIKSSMQICHFPPGIFLCARKLCMHTFQVSISPFNSPMFAKNGYYNNLIEYQKRKKKEREPSVAMLSHFM